MWYRLELISGHVSRAINHMDSQEWMVMSVVVIALGVIFLRGFGSRTSY